jgi:hypothetical protein
MINPHVYFSREIYQSLPDRLPIHLALFTLATPVNMDEEDLIDFTAQPRVEGLGGLRLPTFWVAKPASWFITAESRFRLHGINREQNRYDYLVVALSKEAVSLVLDIVENPPQHHPYTALKERLLESHQLNDYQRVSLLFRMEPLGGRKPSELLAAMLELCPRGHESSIFFTHLFLERLPAELRILLGEDDHQNPRDVAKKADSLWSLHKMNLVPGAAVASVEGSSSVDGLFSAPSGASTGSSAVAAVSSRGMGRGGRGSGRGGRGGCGGRPSGVSCGGAQPPAGGQQVGDLPQASPSLRPADLARIQHGLCFYHFNFGEQAHNCVAPCNWGN